MPMFRPTLIAAAMILSVGAAHASPGDCFLRVSSRTYLNGPCNIILSPGGSFSIGAGEHKRSRYFASVEVDPNQGKARGFWNGVEAAGHAQEELGTLVRQGGCWTNAGAKVCAWRPGTRPASF